MSDDAEEPDLRDDEIGDRAVLTQRLLTAVGDVFGLQDVIEARDIGGTYNLNTLLRTAKGAYVARVYRPWVTETRLAALQRTRATVAHAGLPVPEPLVTRAGRTILDIDGRLVEVEPFVPHDGVADSWDRYAQAFALLGRLHDALSATPTLLPPPRVSNYGAPARLRRWTACAGAALRALAQTSEIVEAQAICREADRILQGIDGWWRQDGMRLPRQLIHGDYGGGNILFRDGRIMAVLDFDFLGVRERVYELAYTTYWLLARLEPDTPPDRYPWPKVAGLLAAYNAATVRPLTGRETRALPLEMARVPLYWIAEAGFTPDPLRSVLAMAPAVARSRWLLEHADDIAQWLV